MTDSELLAQAAPNVINRQSRLLVADAALAAHTTEQRDSRRCRACHAPTTGGRWWCSEECRRAEDGHDHRDDR